MPKYRFNKELFSFKTKAHIRFNDIDVFGHVNNAIHLSLFEQARIDYFNNFVSLKINWQKQGIILGSVEVDYLTPMLFNHSVEIYVRCSKIGGKSFELEYLAVHNDGTQEIPLSFSKSVLVAFDYQANTSMVVPELWKNKLIALEKNESILL